MAVVAGILGSLVGVVATWLMLVLLLASAPNSTPTQWRATRAWLIGVACAGLGGMVGGLVLMAVGRAWIAAGVGAAPAVFSVLTLAVMLRRERAIARRSGS